MTTRGSTPAPRRVRAARVDVLFTRPAGQGGALVRALRAQGARAFNLPAASVRERPQAMAELRAATRADRVIFTSANAVRAAWSLWPSLKFTSRARVFAVGPATRRALARRGVDARCHATRFDSEGVLALDELQAISGRRVALISAPGGRDLLASSLRARGARVTLVGVYERVPARWNARHRAAVAGFDGGISAWSSVEALTQLRARLDDDAWRALCSGVAVVASERVAESARALGLRRVKIAGSARARDLVAAVVAALGASRAR